MKIRVLTYNIHKGFSTTGTVFTLHSIREVLRKTHPDIVLLQEVVGENKRYEKRIHNWPRVSQLEFLADQYWKSYQYAKNAIYDGRHHGNAILSKFPISFFENTNISTNRWEQRGLLHAQVDFPETGKKIHVFNTHLNLLEKSRLVQIKTISDHISKVVPSNSGYILGGDFNDWTGNIHKSFTTFQPASEAFIHTKNEFPKTFPSPLPVLSLDRLYFNGINIESAEVLQGPPWNQLSDHLPLLVEFKI